ncbi:MAG: DUF1840 family protein [Burkholderiaceae bacterium]
MIYQFKSRAAGSVSASQAAAELILETISHPVAPKGIITVDQMPAAIQALKQLNKGEDTGAAVAAHTDSFVRMLEEAMAGGADITWGV